MHTLLLQASGNPNMWSNVLFFGALILVFYFFMIRPQQKKAKDQKKFREELKKGMNVITIGGLHGKLVSLDADTVLIEVDRGITLKFDKTAISMDASQRVNTANA